MKLPLPIIFAIFTVFLDAVGFGIILPVTPQLIQEVTQNADLANAAIWGGILTSAFALMQLIFSPSLGKLSDIYGRRLILLLSLSVMAVDYVVMALANSLWLLLIGRIIGGIAASTHATANALVADYSPPNLRAQRFGLLGAGMGLGFIFGPLIGGALAEFGTRAPFWAAFLLALLNTGFGFFVLPRTKKPNQSQKPTAMRQIFLDAAPWRVIGVILSITAVRKLYLVMFILTLSTAVYPAIWPYFAAFQFNWGPSMVGISLTCYGGIFAITQGLLIRPMTNILGNAGAVKIGLLITTLGLISAGFITRGDIVLLIVAVSAVGSIAVPALTSLMSQATPDDCQGALQGAIASQSALAMVISPLVMNPIFAYFSGPTAAVHLPGAPFVISAMMCLSALLITMMRPANSQYN